MKDLIILTDNPISQPTCAELLINSFPSLELLNNDEETLYMKKSGKGFEMWFSPSDRLDNPDCLMEDTIDKCPNKKAYLTNLSYTSKYIAKKIVSLIEPLYGSMWIQSDEEDDWFGNSQDFIEHY